jgi:hypothetical protein
LVNPLRLTLHIGMFFAQDADAIPGVGLNGLDNGADLASGRGGPLSKLSDLLGDYCEASAMFSSADGLNRRVEGEHVRTAGYSPDQVHGHDDFSGSVLQTADLSSVGLDLAEQPIDPLNDVVHLFETQARFLTGPFAGDGSFLCVV